MFVLRELDADIINASGRAIGPSNDDLGGVFVQDKAEIWSPCFSTFGRWIPAAQSTNRGRLMNC